MKTKTCTKCNTTKNIEDFAIRKTNPDGTKEYRNECKECVRLEQRERRQKDKEQDKKIIPAVKKDIIVKKDTTKKIVPAEKKAVKEKSNITMDRIMKVTSDRVSKEAKKLNLKKSILLSSLLEIGLDKLNNDADFKNEVLNKYSKM